MHSRLQDRRRVRVGVVGVGNCASSLVQGLTYYRDAKSNEPVPGLMNADIGGYHCWSSFFLNDKGWVPVDISEAWKHQELKGYYFGHQDASRVEFSAGGCDHRLEVGGVESLGADFGRDDDLLGGDGGLRVVALDPAARGLQVARVGVGHVQLTCGLLGQRVGLDVRARPGHPLRPV